MRRVPIGEVLVTRLAIGGNPFSGFSHQGALRDREMREFYTPARTCAALARAEAAGLNTFFGRTDENILGIVRDFWRSGGTLQWFAQVCTERARPDAWRTWLERAASTGACAAYIHGGVVDRWFHERRFDLFEEALARMRDRRLAAGFAGHNPEAHKWIRDHLDVDFQMCSHYNPTDRSRAAAYRTGAEKWSDADREAMLAVIATIRRPVVHYKVLAGGNRPVAPAFERLGQVMRATDVACLGMCTRDNPDVIAEDVALFARHVDREAENAPGPGRPRPDGRG